MRHSMRMLACQYSLAACARLHCLFPLQCCLISVGGGMHVPVVHLKAACMTRIWIGMPASLPPSTVALQCNLLHVKPMHACVQGLPFADVLPFLARQHASWQAHASGSAAVSQVGG